MIITRTSTNPIIYNFEISYPFKTGYEVLSTNYSAEALSNTSRIAILLRENAAKPNILEHNFQQDILGVDSTKKIHVIVTITIENATTPIITHQESSYEIEKPISKRGRLFQK